LIAKTLTKATLNLRWTLYNIEIRLLLQNI